MTATLSVAAGLLAVVAACVWLAALRQEHVRLRRELRRRLIVQAAEQRMRAIDRLALRAMFDAVRGRWPS